MRRHGAEPDSSAARRLLRGAVALAAVATAFAALPAVASASQLIARNTSTERLEVSVDGKALLTYNGSGGLRRVLAWGAIGARHPTREQDQVQFKVDYSGGWGSTGRAVWKTFRNTCGRYRGPEIPYAVAACTARDGSHWALQRWQRHQANYGIPPWKPGHGAWELRLAHWRGPIAVFEVWLDWSYSNRWHHLFGRLTYQEEAVYGFEMTREGDPLDLYGRVLYLDTLDSALGPGWKRENGFVARIPDGTFCYGFVPHRTHTGEVRPAAHGRRYRLSTSGPGVTPDVMWEGPGLNDFDPASKADQEHEARMNAFQAELVSGAKPCHT